MGPDSGLQNYSNQLTFYYSTFRVFNLFDESFTMTQFFFMDLTKVIIGISVFKLVNVNGLKTMQLHSLN